MASFTLTNPYLTVNAADWTSYVRGVTADFQIDTVDNTYSSTSGWRSMIGGLKSGSITVELNQSMTNTEIDSLAWPLFIAGSAVAFLLQAQGSSLGPNNPKWTGNCLLTNWTPVSGSVGDLASVSLNLVTVGTVTRATA